MNRICCLGDSIVDSRQQTLTDIVDIDPQSASIYDVYREAADIYRQTNIAMGREPQFQVTTESTITTRRLIVNNEQ